MNLKNWTSDHTKGVLLGMVFPLICIPLVILILSVVQDYGFGELWNRFLHFYQVRIQVLTMAIIGNLGIFYLFLNKERYNIAMGIILGSLVYAPYIIYIKFF
ncbi:MAG: hypothetical protein A3D92_00325 [Bacteroidetes bacterium RIFCSPHIGHO2_02_FULL_44_7]|nr:MAG: hypothetical protein A3D92_00325 [Bacteroidetes bacterium RIFCSPHIGHO2_02_FULL_44_7]